VGPTAIAQDYCGARELAEAPWRVAASYAWLASELRFGAESAPFHQLSVAVSITRRLGAGFTVQAGAGAVTGGGIDAAGVSYAMQPGWIARLGSTWLALDGKEGPWPFLAVSASLAASGVRTAASGQPEEALTALDLGLSASAGKAFFGVVAPYVGARVFGGPVEWTIAGRPVTGTDVNHWQVAFGVAASLPLGLDALLEWAPFGEHSLVAQAGWAF